MPILVWKGKKKKRNTSLIKPMIFKPYSSTYSCHSRSDWQLTERGVNVKRTWRTSTDKDKRVQFGGYQSEKSTRRHKLVLARFILDQSLRIVYLGEETAVHAKTATPSSCLIPKCVMLWRLLSTTTKNSTAAARAVLPSPMPMCLML